MEELRVTQELLLNDLINFKRYLSPEMDWSDRLIAIKGARGTGKTTLMLQRIKFELPEKEKKQALYVSLDDLYFLDHTLLDLLKVFQLNGGKYLFLDEVHKYPNWSRELKLIYDRYKKVKIVFTSSSMLDILGGESDLSRRAVSYNLQELSYREFLEIEYQQQLPTFTLEEIVKDHQTIVKQIKKKIEFPVKDFNEYLRIGAYPYYTESKISYIKKLQSTIMLIIENDMNAVENVSYEESRKIKKLLIAIAQSAPFTPNISKLSERLGISRKNLIHAIRLLSRADLVIELFSPNKGIGAFTKPEKLYLHNTNLIYALDDQHHKKGTLRETFFANQLIKDHELNLPKKGDFLVDEQYVFEVGGKSKTRKQILQMENSFVVRDDIEMGTNNSLPLWLFGFMY